MTHLLFNPKELLQSNELGEVAAQEIAKALEVNNSLKHLQIGVFYFVFNTQNAI